MGVAQDRSVIGGFWTRLKPKNGTPPEVHKYNNKGAASLFVKDIEFLSRYENCFDKEFFSGACFTCGAMASDSEIHLKRCSGCKLVSYCNKNCQKGDWRAHQVLCKKFHIEDGKNMIEVFHSKEGLAGKKRSKEDPKNCQKGDSRAQQVLCKKIPMGDGKYPIELFHGDGKEELDGKQYSKDDPKSFLDTVMLLQMTAFWAFTAYSDPKDHGAMTYHTDRIFLNARVCNFCLEARPEKLFDCRCCAVSYCTKEHRMQDVDHLVQCDPLHNCALANLYLTQHQLLKIPDGLLNEVNLNEGLNFENISKLDKYSNEKWLQTIINLINERLAFPLTIHYALKTLKLGEQSKALNDITSLNIHIVHKTVMLDPRMWEFFLHQLPNLKKLHLTFISWRLNLKNKYNSCLPIKRCTGCKIKKRVITYEIQPMRYHEYFSSNDYVEPDVVAVFGTEDEFMSPLAVGHDAHIFTSELNMTYLKHTVVILTDFADDKIEACVKSFNDARKVNVILPVQKNPVCGFSTLRGTNFIINLNSYLCCIQGDH